MLIVFALIRNESWFFVAGPLLGVAAFVYSPMLAALDHRFHETCSIVEGFI
jgi:hypothetical protein